MTAILILNIVFATSVVGGILAILCRGIQLDRSLAVQDTQNRVRTLRRSVRGGRRASAGGGSLKQVAELR